MSSTLTVTGYADLTKSKYGLKELAFKGAAPASSSLTRSVFEHFRCPENFLDLAANGRFSSDAGYFQFGSNVLCYGRSCRSARGSGAQSSSPYDLLDDVVIGDGKVGLPFNPSEVIDNLRLERYAANRSSSNLLRKIYYLFRPLTNLSIRKRIQRFNARHWQDASFPHWPVDTTVESLCETLMLLSLQAKHVASVPFVWFWPRGARGCVVMTHDVETEAGRNFCTELMNIDDSFGTKASFQIVPEGRYTTSASLIDEIRDRGFDVAVQDLNHDGRLFDDRKEFERRVAIVNQYAKKYSAKGFRAGVLYRRPDWFEDLDFSFDMSIPNVAHLDPQRGGCCTVMPYFIGKILELPVTTTQDYSLFHILRQRSIDLWKQQIELVLEKHGMASFIVHPDYVIEPGVRGIYENLLGHLRYLRSENNIWFALPREVDSWWRNRSQMRVEKHGGSWLVVGEGAERAILAYAKNVNGKLAYELANSAGTA
ncbi:MAG: hypothetical protein WBM24_05020 [Candidatus Sulfotelmatobacter sp.]